jgi:FAD/FMN-containing dehydrogenase
MDIVRPGSPRYELVRKPAIARFQDVRPQAVVLCHAPDDVSEALAYARHSGLPSTARSGGHCFAGRSSTEGVVIDVSPMNTVSVDGEMATIGAGARLGDVYRALGAYGLTIPAGCGPTVGIAGLTLGGGFGILGRTYGLTCDRLVHAQVVLADGRIVECDEHHEPDLFWALRGAGVGRGVVTSLTFRTVPAPHATSFQLTWPYEHAAKLIETWQAWSPMAPDECAASLLVDENARLFGAVLGTESTTVELLGQFVDRVGMDPVSTVTRYAPYPETKQYLAELGGDAGDEVTYSKSEYFARPIPTDAIQALLTHGADLDFSPWGGAYNRVPVDATAFAHRDALFLLKQTARTPAKVARSWESVHRWGTGGVYPNFPDPDLENPERAYHGANYERLARI